MVHIPNWLVKPLRGLLSGNPNERARIILLKQGFEINYSHGVSLRDRLQDDTDRVRISQTDHDKDSFTDELSVPAVQEIIQKGNAHKEEYKRLMGNTAFDRRGAALDRLAQINEEVPLSFIETAILADEAEEIFQQTIGLYRHGKIIDFLDPLIQTGEFILSIVDEKTRAIFLGADILDIGWKSWYVGKLGSTFYAEPVGIFKRERKYIEFKKGNFMVIKTLGYEFGTLLANIGSNIESPNVPILSDPAVSLAVDAVSTTAGLVEIGTRYINKYFDGLAHKTIQNYENTFEQRRTVLEQFYEQLPA